MSVIQSGVVGASLARDGQAQFVPMTLADKLMGVIGAQGILAALIKAMRDRLEKPVHEGS